LRPDFEQAVLNPAFTRSVQFLSREQGQSVFAEGGIGSVKRVVFTPGRAARENRGAGTKAISGAYRTLAGRKMMGLVAAKRPVVLIVEDEFLLRMDVAEVIGAAGFEVIEAANADEAIEVLEARRDVMVVFTDIQMPGSMDGLKLARAVRGRWPPIKIVATSGRLNVRETDLPEGGRFLPKPYSSAEVTGVLRQLTTGV
jgi:CheY-like chemotaxis protein